MENTNNLVFISSFDSGNAAVQVYDLSTGANVKTYRGPPLSRKSLAKVGSCNLLAAEKGKGFMRAWKINGFEPLQTHSVVPGKVSCLDVNIAGPKYCVIGISEKLYIYHLQSGHLLSTISRHYQPVSCVKFTSCGNFFSSGGDDGFVYLWSMADLIEHFHKCGSQSIKPFYILGQHLDKVSDIALTASGMNGQLISTSLDKTAKVFDMTSGSLRYNLVTSAEVTSLVTNELGSQIYLGGINGKIQVFNLLPHSSVGDIKLSDEGLQCHEQSITCMALSPMGNVLVSGGSEGDVKLWSVFSDLESLRKGNVGKVNLAFQRMLYSGRGLISNLQMHLLNLQLLSATNLNSDEVISAFSTKMTRDRSEAVVDIPLQGYAIKQKNIKSRLNDPVNCILEDAGSDNGQMLKKLKRANAELFKFALSELLNKDN